MPLRTIGDREASSPWRKGVPEGIRFRLHKTRHFSATSPCDVPLHINREIRSRLVLVRVEQYVVLFGIHPVKPQLHSCSTQSSLFVLA